MQTVSTKACMRPEAGMLLRRSVERSSSGSTCCEAALRQRTWPIAASWGQEDGGVCIPCEEPFRKRGNLDGP